MRCREHGRKMLTGTRRIAADPNRLAKDAELFRAVHMARVERLTDKLVDRVRKALRDGDASTR